MIMGKKKLLLMMIFCIIGSVSCYAQATISSVYGVNLGDSESVVTSKISGGSWKTNSKGQRYYTVSNPTLGNCAFQNASFWFNNGKLTSVNFSSFAFGIDWGMVDTSSREYDFAKSKEIPFRNLFDKMKVNLTQKYGQPVIDSNDEIIWQSSNRQIRLWYEFKDEIDSYNNPVCECQVAVVYKLGVNSSNDNF